MKKYAKIRKKSCRIYPALNNNQVGRDKHKEGDNFMSLVDTIKEIRGLLSALTIDLEKAANGNKAASQRVRTGTIKLEKSAKKYRKESIKAEKSGSFKKPSAAKKAAKPKAAKAAKVVKKAAPPAKAKKPAKRK